MAIAVLPPRPTWRGRLHTWAFVVAIPAAALLIVEATHAAAVTAAAIYTGSLLAVFGTSAAYHRLATGPRARAVMQRLDHCMIYVLIAGSYVPMCIVALPPAWGIPLLCLVSAGAVAGMVIKGSGVRRARWVGDALYPLLGWAALGVGPALVRSLTPGQLALVVAGGAAYTLGFPVLLRRWPDPWPRAFGYHEVWHVFTVVAAGLHFVAFASIVAG